MASPTDAAMKRDKTFVCIEYPGNVVNVDKMLETLGGIEAISKVYANPTHRLELKFRPEDTECKPAYGDRFNTTRLLMKVTKRRAKNNPEDFTCHSEILGRIDHTYKFKSMMDFQYLPMKRNETGSYESIIPDIIPLQLETKSWLQKPASLLLTPMAFSRIDNPVDYHFRADPKPKNPAEPRRVPSDNIISRIRKKRTGYTIFLTYDEENVPVEQKPATKLLLLQKRCNNEMLQRVKEAFELKPIWSKYWLATHLKTDKSELKYLLPVVAYYFTSGPWRSLWVKYTYDPRLDPKAKPHQIIDFRLRKGTHPNLLFGRSRQNYVHSVKYNTSQSKPPTIMKDTLESVASTSSDAQNSEQLLEQERFFKFRYGIFPPLHQMFYQLCNIEVDEVQTLVHSNDGKEKICTERDGFCTPGILNQCRDIMVEIANKTFADYRAKNADPSQEESMEGDENEASGSGVKKSPNVDDSEESDSEVTMPSEEEESDSN